MSVLATDVVDLLCASESLFFAAGAESRAVGGATVSWLPGLTHLAAGAVVHGVDEAAFSAPEVEAVLREAGAAYARVYVRTEVRDGELRRRGYRRRVEIGFTVPDRWVPPRTDVALRPVRTAADWAEKRALHERAGAATALGAVPAAEWVELERRRAGVVRPHFVTLDGEVVGSLGVIDLDRLVRPKNLLVEDGRRRVGVGTTAVAALRRNGLPLAFYALAGSGAEAAYRSSGWPEVDRQCEWKRPL